MPIIESTAAAVSRATVLALLALAALSCSSCVFAARSVYRQVAQARDASEFEEAGAMVSAADLPAGIRIEHDVAYGSDHAQRLDVYAPAHAQGAPVILMLHGGGWARGDKAMARVVTNKVQHWVPKGVIVVSADYRMLPTPVATQADDAAHALAFVQQHAAQWGGDGARVVLMGHSAGAHLAALLAASPTLAANAGAKPWRGTVLLDSAAFDVGVIMRTRHLPLYDRAFGKDEATWAQLSPTQQLAGRIAPVLAVCSSRRMISCAQAQAFADKARGFGGSVTVHPENRSHGEINAQLGEAGAYTEAVDAFLHEIGALAGAPSAGRHVARAGVSRQAADACGLCAAPAADAAAWIARCVAASQA